MLGGKTCDADDELWLFSQRPLLLESKYLPDEKASFLPLRSCLPRIHSSCLSLHSSDFFRRQKPVVVEVSFKISVKRRLRWTRGKAFISIESGFLWRLAVASFRVFVQYVVAQ